MMAESDWLAILRALDEALPPREPLPSIQSLMEPIEGSPGKFRFNGQAWLSVVGGQKLQGRHVGWEVPQNFDRAAAQARFDMLAERLSDIYHVRLVAGTGPQQDAACFGEIGIAAKHTKTSATHPVFQFPLTVIVSNFGNLVTYHHALVAHNPPGDPSTLDVPERPPVHPDDQRRVEEVLTALGYVVVPKRVLNARYDGPNAGPTSDMTWYTRFFDYL
jgi:hypothetical protein